MVRRVIELIYKEVRGLHSAAYVLALFTFGSQLLALLRDRLLAGEFGASVELDLYYAAFRIPDLLYVFFASTLSVYVLIPFIARRQKEGEGRASKLLSDIASVFTVLYTLLALMLAFFAPWYVPKVFPGLAAEFETLVLLIQILLIQPLLLGISSICGVITQLGHRFVLYALSPVLYNLGIIGGLLFLYPTMGISGLAIGVVVGALLHLSIQLPFVFKSVLRPHFVTQVEWAALKEVLYISLPRALTLSLHQIVLLALVSFATLMSVGSVSVFQFAFNLQSVPLAIIGVSYSVAAFPLLAEYVAEKKMREFKVHMETAIHHIIFWSVPAITLIIVIRAQLVRVVLGAGAFDWDDTRLTAAILALLVISLAGQALNLLLVRGCYALGKTKLPFYVTLFSSVVILISAYGMHQLFLMNETFRNAFETLMRLSNVPGTEVVALAFGYTFGILVHTVLLLILARRSLHVSLRDIALRTLYSLLAGLLGALAAYATLNFIVAGLKTDTLIGIFTQGLISGVVGIVVTGFGYGLLRSPELGEIMRSLNRKTLKTEVVAPQDEDHLSV